MSAAQETGRYVSHLWVDLAAEERRDACLAESARAEARAA